MPAQGEHPCDHMIFFSQISVLNVWEHRHIKELTETIRQGQVFNSCRDIEALCDDKVQGMTKRVSWTLYMLC